MKKIAKYVYIIKILLFIINFHFVFSMLNNILDTTIYGGIFIALYLILSFNVLLEILSKKLRYQNDIIYNLMQIGLMFYLLIVSIKINAANLYVTRITMGYFKTNYTILSLLIIFILAYNFVELKSSKK